MWFVVQQALREKQGGSQEESEDEEEEDEEESEDDDDEDGKYTRFWAISRWGAEQNSYMNSSNSNAH